MQQHLPLAVLKQILLAINSTPAMWLQQHLPLAVLKQTIINNISTSFINIVATAPTACGIETFKPIGLITRPMSQVATAPTACGIETSYYIGPLHRR